MTQVNDIDIESSTNYLKYLDHGFVGLIDTMGTDESIVQAARVSYGKGTKGTRNDRALIRYLVKHKHTSPVEMCEVKFHLKMPIFVMRQHVRHRTANLNEYSGRYSVMSDEFYIPNRDNLKPQSTSNKQGRGGKLPPMEEQMCFNTIKRIGSTDVTFNNPGMGNKFFRELTDNAGFELRVYSDQAVFIEKPAKATKITGLTY